MTRTLLPRLAATPALLRKQCTNPHLPGEVRLALWCWGHHDQHGHARAQPGQLLHELQLGRATNVSRVIGQARDHGLIDQCSTAACVVLPGHSVAPCEAHHRQAA